MQQLADNRRFFPLQMGLFQTKGRRSLVKPKRVLTRMGELTFAGMTKFEFLESPLHLSECAL